MPDCAEFLFGFKARQQLHKSLCACWRNAEAEQKDLQEGIFFDRNRLSAAIKIFLKTFLCVLAVWSGAIGAMQDPREVVIQTIERTRILLNAERAQIEQRPGRIYGLVEDIVVPHFDFARIARWVLGKYWWHATAAQRERFTREFREHLVRIYAIALLDYAKQDINYLALHAGAKDTQVLVRTEVNQVGGPPIPMHYAMYLQGDAWKVYDVRIDGVSLVTNYRSGFSSHIRRAGLDQLIEELAVRNRGVDQ